MKPRDEAARFAERQLVGNYVCKFEKGRRHHYGLQDIRELLDFVYGGPPETPEQCVQVPELSKYRKPPPPRKVVTDRMQERAKAVQADGEISRRLAALLTGESNG